VIPSQIVWQIGNSVLFPALSRSRRSPAGMQEVYRRTLRPVLALGVLPAACLAAAGPELIEILYDPRYAEAGWMIQILAIGAWLQVPQASSGAAVLAMGEPRWLAVANGMKFLGMVILLPVGYAGFGPAGAIAGLVGAEFFRYATLAIAVRRFGLPSFGSDLGFSILAAGATASGWIASAELAGLGFGALARGVAAVSAVTLVSAATAAVLFRDALPALLQGLRERVGWTRPSHV
jgi:O-antigen/teichoic acid export membrane protein